MQGWPLLHVVMLVIRVSVGESAQFERIAAKAEAPKARRCGRRSARSSWRPAPTRSASYRSISSTLSPLRSAISLAYLDTRVYALYDPVSALCYGPISENIHGFDERVSLASLRRVTTAMAFFIAEWCGLKPAAARSS